MSSESIIRFLVVEEGSTRREEITHLPLTLGRSDKADIMLQDTRSSRLHARVEECSEGVLLTDLDSSNGTFRGGERIKQVVLAPGDEFSIGEAEITFLGRRDAHARPPASLSHMGIALEDEIGHGVVSRVFLAQQEAMTRTVIVKFLQDDFRSDLGVTALFKDRIREQSRVNHPGLASVIDSGDADGVAYCVLERLEGRTLADLLATGWAFDSGATSGVMHAILELLANLHAQGRCLTTLDADAIIISPEGVVGITSLGFPFQSVSDQPWEFLDALAWLAPEAVPRPEEAGEAGDLHLVGALARCLLEHRQPRRGATERELLESLAAGPLPALAAKVPVSSGFKKLIESLSAADPGERPESARAALAELEALGESLSGAGAAIVISGGRGKGAGPPARGMTKKQMKRISWAITGALMIGLNLGVFWWFQSHGQAVREWFSGGGGGDDAGPVESEIPGTPEPPIQIQTPRTTPETVRAEWDDLVKRILGLLESGNFSSAVAALERFESRYPDAPESETARTRLTSVTAAWRAGVEPLVETIRRHLDEKDVKGAGTAVVRARQAGAMRTHADEFTDLVEELKQLEAAAEKAAAEAAAAAGAGEAESGATGEQPEPGSGEPGILAPSAWSKALPRALDAPWDIEQRQALLDSLDKAGDPGSHVSDFRMLMAEERIFTALVESMNNQINKPITLELEGGKTVSGILKASSAVDLAVETSEKAEAVMWKQIPLIGWLKFLEKLPATTDRYLVQARINRGSGRPEEAWFDLHAARALSGDDDKAATDLANALILRLSKRHGNGRRRDK